MVEHFLLFGLLYFISFLLLRYQPKRITTRFWPSVALFIFVYTIVVGSRYGWGNDYLSYKSQYENLLLEEGADYGYYKLSLIENALGFSFWAHISLCAFLYVSGSYYLIKKTGAPNSWMLILFLPITLLFSTYAIRQSLAISIIYFFIGLFVFNQGRMKKYQLFISLLLIIFAISIHFASILFLIPFLLFCLFKNVKAINWKLVVILYILTIIFKDRIVDYLNEIIETYLPQLDLDNHFQGYADNINKWVGEDAAEDKFLYSGFYKYFVYLLNICILFISGKKLSNNNRNVAIIYNIYAIALILQEIFFSYEMMRRILDPFVLLSFIPLGYAIGNIKLNLFKPSVRDIAIAVLLAIILLGVYFPSFSFMTSFKWADFVWNHY